MPASKTLREITGMGYTPTTIGKSALILIDCQNTYREGVMQLEGVEPALVECQTLLNRFRDAGRPVIHIQHDAGAGSPYDVNAPIGAIADVVKPQAGEPVVVKNYPSSFEKTNLDDLLKGFGVEEVDACRIHDARLRQLDRARRVQSRLSRRRSSAMRLRRDRFPIRPEVSCRRKDLHDASLAALHDIFAVVVPSARDDCNCITALARKKKAPREAGPLCDSKLGYGYQTSAATLELIQSSSFFFCTIAPVCWAATLPPLKISNVGIARMPYVPVTFGFSSTSTLTTLTLPVISLAT